MALETLDLWTLTRGRPQIDPHDLAEAIAHQVQELELDYRTRLLIRDSVEALRLHWGEAGYRRWLASGPTKTRIEEICGGSFEGPGFPSLRGRLMERTKAEDVKEFLRELGTRLDKTVTVSIGGSVSLILLDRLARKTEDIDIVDEVPRELREQHSLLEQLEKRYGLHLGHFQSHYLPSRWRDRLHSIEPMGRLEIYLVDPMDVFLGKLTSIREKDLDDLRVLKSQFDKATIVERLRDTMTSTFASEELKKRAKENWYILFGEDLPQ